jgi:TerC family integral membrane protein
VERRLGGARTRAFNALLWWYLIEPHGAVEAERVALEFLTGYLVEKSLAVDNIFVFLMLFTYFAVPAEQQQRALIYGVLGAIALRAIMIFIGAALIAQFHWIFYVFGAFLLLTGIKMLLGARTGARPGEQPDAALDARASAIDAELRRRPLLGARGRRALRTRRCSSWW